MASSPGRSDGGRLAGALAVGTGFRREAWAETSRSLADFDVLEVTVDHYIHAPPRLRARILGLARELPVVVHGVGLSLGTAVLPDDAYLAQVADFVHAVDAPWYSEHLAFTGVPGRDLAQLLPLPRTRECLDVLVENIARVRERVPVPLLLENISYYFGHPTDAMSELEFLLAVLERTGTFLLLDLENVAINGRNHGYDPVGFIDGLPPGVVRAVHLAGGVRQAGLSIDSHNRPVGDEVLGLLAHLLDRQTPDTIVVERDDDLGAFDEVVTDCRRARAVVDRHRARCS